MDQSSDRLHRTQEPSMHTRFRAKVRLNVSWQRNYAPGGLNVDTALVGRRLWPTLQPETMLNRLGL